MILSTDMEIKYKGAFSEKEYNQKLSFYLSVEIVEDHYKMELYNMSLVLRDYTAKQSEEIWKYTLSAALREALGGGHREPGFRRRERRTRWTRPGRGNRPAIGPTAQSNLVWWHD